MRRIALITTIATLSWMGSGPAYAADCESAYTIDALLADMGRVEKGLRTDDTAAVAEAGKALGTGLGCLEELLPRPVASRSYRAVAAGWFAADAPVEAEKWFRTSLELDPVWVYGVHELAEDHPMRLAFDDLKGSNVSEASPVEGKIFGPGEHHIDGRSLSEPEATPNRYHLYQRVQSGGAPDSFVIEGAEFPAEVLEDAAPEPVLAEAPADEGKPEKAKKPKKDKKVKAPKEPKPERVAKADKPEKVKKSKAKVRTKTLADGSVITKRQRPPEKTPLMILGGVIMAGAGGILYAANRSEAKFHDIGLATNRNGDLDTSKPFTFCGDEPDDTCARSPAAEAQRLKRQTNRLLGASIGVFAVGAGTLGWAIAVDGDTIMPHVNLRW